MVLILFATTTVDWEAPAGAIGIGPEARACVYPQQAPSRDALTVRLALLDCPVPGQTARVAVWVTGRPAAGLRDVNVTLTSRDVALHGAPAGFSQLPPGTTHVGTVTLDVPARGVFEVAAHVQARVPTGNGGAWVPDAAVDALVLEVGDRCTVAYRHARPAHATACLG